MNVNNLCMSCMREKADKLGLCPHCGFDESRHEVALHHLPLRTILAAKMLVGKVLGEGGFGITYIGYDLNLNLPVAIKEFYPSGFVTRESSVTMSVTSFQGKRGEFFTHGKEKFVDEARRLARFRNLPGIVAVNDFILENDTAYIVMEYIDGETLKAHLTNSGGSMPSEEVFAVMRPIMESLEKMHREEIIHRDISPDNIMISRTGEVRLIDFGAARDYATDSNKSLSILLKPGYAPIEQYSSRGAQGPWTDVYAICATMYKVITGQTPLESSDRISEDGLKSPSELGAKIDPSKERAIMKGMEFLGKNRYQTIGELIDALYYGAPQSTAHATATPAPQNPPQPKVVTPQTVKPDVARPVHKKSPSSGKKGMIIAIVAVAALFLIAIVSLPSLIGGKTQIDIADSTGEPAQTEADTTPAFAAEQSPNEPEPTADLPTGNYTLSLYTRENFTDEELAELVQQYTHESANVTIEPTFIPAAEYNNKLSLALASGEPMDIILTEAHDMYRLISSGYAMPLNDLFTEEYFSDFSPTLLKAFTDTDGSLYAAPLYYYMSTMYYNADIFEEIGLEIPTDWDTMVQAAQVCTEAGYYGLIIDPYLSGIQPFLYSGGGSLFENGTITLNKPGHIEALTALTDMFNAGIAASHQQLGDSASNIFLSGEAGMFAGFNGFDSQLSETGINHLAAPYIGINGYTSNVFVTGYAMSNYTESPEITADVINYLTSPQRQEYLYVTDAIPAMRSAQTGYLENAPYMTDVLLQTDNADVFSFGPHHSDVINHFFSIEDTLSGHVDPEQALNEVQVIIDGIQ